MILDSLFVKLGFEVDTAKLDDFKTKADELRSSVGKFATIFTGAAVGIGMFVQHVAEGMAEIHDFAELNEVSAKSLAALGKVAVENDSSLDAVKSTIQGLNSVLGEAALGIGRGAMTFKKLGLSAKDADGKVKGADAMLSEIAGKMEGLSRQEQFALAAKLGIDPSMIKLLAQGKDKLEDLREEAERMAPLSDEDFALAEQVDKLFMKAKGTLGAFTKQIAVALMPAVRDALKAYLEWFKAARKATNGQFATAVQVFGAVVRRVYEIVVQMVGGLAKAVKWLVQTKYFAIAAAAALGIFASIKTYEAALNIIKGLRGIAAGLMSVNASALLIPALIGAIILAFVALVDDWMAWKSGGDSVIGDLIKQFPELEGVINGIEEVVRGVGAYFIGLWETIQPAFTKLLGALGGLAMAIWPIAKNIGLALAWAFKLVLPLVMWVVTAIIKIIAGVVGFVVDVVSGIVTAVAWVIDMVSKAFSMGIDGWLGLFKSAFGLIMTGFDMLGKGIVAIWDGVISTITAGFEKVKGIVGWIGEKLGFGGEVSVKAAVPSPGATPAMLSVPAAIAGAPVLMPDAATVATQKMPSSLAAMPGGDGGLLGRSAGGSSTATTTNTTNITAPINLYSNDPATAGKSVREELDRVNKQSTRNGESAVAL